MKITPFTLPAFMLVMVAATSSLSAVAASSCGNSFYCYGDTAKSIVSVTTRPPPIPPPNRHRMQQRNQALLAMRANTPRPVVTAPARPPTTVRPAPSRAAVPSPVASNCPYPTLLDKAGWLESQAVIASTYNDRLASVRLFREAAQARQQAARLGCR